MHELRRNFLLIVEIIRQPVLQLQRCVTRELFDVILDGLKDWHDEF